MSSITSSNTETFTTPADRLRFGATVGVAIDAWFDDLKLNNQSMPQANAAPGIVHTTASVLSNLIEQLWRWLRSWFAQPETAVHVQAPPAGQIWTWYYYAGSQRIAMRVQGSTNPSENGVFYLLTDHLGSTTATLNTAGEVVGQMRYKPWGQTRYANGSTPTDYQFTGQRNTDIGIYYFNARWFDPALGRFLSADTIIPQPGNPLDWDRYAYTNTNPINGTDPTGHMCSDPENPKQSCENGNKHPFSSKHLRYTYYKGNVWASLPKPQETRKGENYPSRPDEFAGSQSDWDSWVKTSTLANYEGARRQLFTNGYGHSIDGSGKIDDVTLVALVSFLEFGDFKELGSDFKNIYEASLSALSYQYAENSYVHNGPPICGVMCMGISEQLVWLQAFHVMRADISKAFSNNGSQPFAALITDASKVTSERFGVYSSFGNGSGSICSPVPYQTYCVK